MTWYKEMGGRNDKGYFQRGLIVENTEQAKERYRLKFNNIDVYETAYSYETREIRSSRLYGSFYLDFDDKLEESYDKVKSDVLMTMETLRTSFGIKEHQVELFFSGNKGFHMLINPILFDIRPKEKLNEDYKKIANYIKERTVFKTIDTVIYDNVRLLRLVNSINSKSNLYKVQISFSQLRDLSFSQMKEWAKKPRPYKRAKDLVASPMAKHTIHKILTAKSLFESQYGRREITETEQILPCTLLGLETDCSKGGRNNMVILLASTLFQAKQNFEEIVEILLEWNEQHCQPSLSEKEVITTVRSALYQIQTGKCYGCRAMFDNDLCIGNACKIFKKRM